MAGISSAVTTLAFPSRIRVLISSMDFSMAVIFLMNNY